MAEDPENEAGLREIPASEILDKIQKGESVEYDHVRIREYLNLSKLDLPAEHVARTEFQTNILKLPAECKIVSSSIEITNSKFEGTVAFSNCLFRECVDLSGSTFNVVAFFSGAIFCRNAKFHGDAFSTVAFFNGATLGGNAFFDGAMFGGGPDFEGAMFSRETHFEGATFRGPTVFRGVTFRGLAAFNRATFSEHAEFRGATFSGFVYFMWAKFEGDFLTFRDTTFVFAKSQEDACRRAKNVLAKAGNRDEEEYHFYREMEAKRIQKGIRGNSGLGLGYWLKTETWSFWKFFLHDVIEYIFVQKIFGYGVHPYWLFGWWFAIVVTFAIIYWIKGGIEEPDAKQWFDYLWFSIATAATPGYALYRPVGLFKFMAGIEAILGTFMWAAFITTFARKFSR